MLPKEHLDILLEILDCDNCVMNNQFDRHELEILGNLEDQDMVRLVWVVTDKGKGQVEKQT